MPQPWEQYAAKSTPPPSGDGPWNNYGNAAPEDTRNDIQKSFDTNTQTSPNEPLLETALKSVVGGIGSPFIHPVQTAKSVMDMVSPMGEDGDFAKPSDHPFVKMAHGIHDDYEAGGVPYAGTKLAGNIFGGMALGAPVDAAAPLVRAFGGAAERGGLGVINHAIDATPKMMKYGQNPARGLVDEGIAPSLSKFSLGNKLETSLPEAGQRVSDAVHGSNITAPYADIAKSIESPIHAAADVSSGFGGGKSVDPLANLWASAEEQAPGARQPIYGNSVPSGAGVPATDLWQSIRNLDKNTRFNPDPEVEGVNEVRRDMRGGLRGNLEDAVPGLKPLSQRYGDLATADEALSRTAGKGSSLGDLRKAFSFPLETTVGTGMVKGGRLLAKTPNASPFFYSAPAFGRSKENQ